jgi:dCMP deaminase
MSLIESIKKVDHRPCWEEYFMSVAYLISKRSSCDRLHVGCVIVNNKRIITTGYNGHIKGAPHTSTVRDGHEQMTIHAETNAITDAAYRGIKLSGSTAYITHYPCINCAKNLISAGIKEVIYAEDYKNDDICAELYSLAKVKIYKYCTEKNTVENDNQKLNNESIYISLDEHIL